MYGRPARTGCVYVYESSVFPTRTSFATERTAPTSPSFPAVIVHCTRNHSPMSQYLPTRFQTSAAGRSTVTSIVIATYVGFATTISCDAGGAAGACALAMPATQTASAQAPNVLLN